MRTFGHRVSEPEIKFLLLVLLGLGALATAAGSEAVLPAYLVGLVTAGAFLGDRVLMDRMRSIAFALLTPFFFLRAGLLISAPALVGGVGVIAVLFLTKMVAKVIGVWPIAAAFGVKRRERNYITLLMATGLTFGSISALYGLNHGLVTQAQYSELLTVVILSAVVPTLVAQQLFQPRQVDAEEEEALGAEDAGLRPPRRPALAGRLSLLRKVAELAHQLLEELAGFGVGHQLLLHLLRGTADLGVAEEALRHPLEARRHILHGCLLRHLDEDGLAGGGDHGLRLRADHLDPFATEALALETAVAHLRAKAIERDVKLRHIGGTGHRPQITRASSSPRTWTRSARRTFGRSPCA